MHHFIALLCYQNLPTASPLNYVSLIQAAKSDTSRSPVTDNRTRCMSEPAEMPPHSPAVIRKVGKNSLVTKKPSLGPLRRPGSATACSPSVLPPTTPSTADTDDEVGHVTVM